MGLYLWIRYTHKYRLWSLCIDRALSPKLYLNGSVLVKSPKQQFWTYSIFHSALSWGQKGKVNKLWTVSPGHNLISSFQPSSFLFIQQFIMLHLFPLSTGMSVTVSVCFCSLFTSKKSLIRAVTLSMTVHSHCAQSLRWFSIKTTWQGLIYISLWVAKVSARDWRCFGSAFQSVMWGCPLFLGRCLVWFPRLFVLLFAKAISSQS